MTCYAYLKKTLLFVIIVGLNVSCGMFKPDDKTQNSPLSLDAIQADQKYYTKAILEYQLVNMVLQKSGVKASKTVDDVVTTTMNLDVKDEDGDYVLKCNYKVPTTLEDLTSGFQYRYYVFSGESKAAMKAFGIADVNSNSSIEYLIIDYLQFEDFYCYNMPKIRYAVGIRSELRINKSSLEAEANGIGSLSGLAAQVELGKAEVSFSLKTIGITGAESRMNIPQGVSFDVTTYKDFQNTIDFIKSRFDDSTVVISPQIIPVTDDYRPSTKEALDVFRIEIIELNKAMKETEEDEDIPENKKQEILEIYQKEIDRLIKEKTMIHETNEQLYSMQKYEQIIDHAVTIGESKEQALEEKRQELKGTAAESNFMFGYPNIDKLNKTGLYNLKGTYTMSDDITIKGFERFMAAWEKLNPTDADLELVNKNLEESLSPDDALLEKTLEDIKALR